MQQGFKMCTADMSFHSLVSQIHEDKQSRITTCRLILLMHNLCTISDLAVDKPCTNRGKTYLERGQGYWSVQLISCCATARFWIHPIYYTWATIWVSIWILLMAQEFRQIQFYGQNPWPLFRSCVAFIGLYVKSSSGQDLLDF